MPTLSVLSLLLVFMVMALSSRFPENSVTTTLGAFCRIATAVRVGVRKMADGDIDLYADDLEQDFAQVTRISL